MLIDKRVLRRYANRASFPNGVLKSIYLAEDTNIFYVWTGSDYAQVIDSSKSWDGESNDFASLPPAASHNGELYLTLTTTGAWPSKNYAGFYVSNGSIWTPTTNLQGILKNTDVKNDLISTDTDKPLSALQGKTLQDNKVNLSLKDSSGGYAGLTNLKINFKNVADTFISFFTNTNTASRTYTFQDRDGTIADNTDLANKQPLDSDLTAIVGLSPSNDDIIQRKASAWTNRTMAQLKTDLALDSASSPEFTSLTLLNGLNVGYSGSLIADRINIGDNTFYLDRTDSNIPLIAFDSADYIAYNKFSNYLETVIGGVQVAKINSDGAMTLAKQPAFHRYANANLTNVTGDGTPYTIVFNTEIFDRSSNMTSTTFTAPVTGIYDFSGIIGIFNVVSSGATIVLVELVTSNAAFKFLYRSSGGLTAMGDNDAQPWSCNNIEMDSGDTAYVVITVSGGTKTIILNGSDRWTSFSGRLAV